MIEKFGGCDEYFTEMINAGSLLTGGPFEKYYLINETVPQKMVWQLTGGKTPLMIEAASMLASCGGIGIDLNMGCCAPEIVSSGAGIAWMLKPVEETRAMVRGVRQAIDKATGTSADGAGRDVQTVNHVKRRLSIKLRLGDEDFSDEGFFSFCDMLVDEGVEQITLHPRTRKQKYSRPARWSYVQRLAEKMHKRGVIVILNGDVKDVESARRALQEAPDADGIMIARAACQKPWIFARIANALNVHNTQNAQNAFDAHNSQNVYDAQNALAAQNEGTHFAFDDESQKHLTGKKIYDSGETVDLYQLVCEYLDDIQVYQPKEFWKTRCQRFFTYFCDNFSFAHYAKTQLVNSSDINQAKERLAMYFEKVPEDRYIKL